MTDPPIGGWGPPPPPGGAGGPPPPPAYPQQPGHPQPPEDPRSGYPQQPGYPQPGHQGGGSHGYHGPPPPSGTNGFAIASLVFGIIGGVLFSVIFGVIALRQIKQKGQGGKGLAVAGLVLSTLWLVLVVVIVAAAVFLEADRDEAGEIVDSGSVSIFDLEVGDCLRGIQEASALYSADAVPCSREHRAEVFATYDVPADTWPGLESLSADADELCAIELGGYSPAAAEDPSVEIYYFHPTEESWAQGDRTVACVAATPPRTGSLRG